MVMRRFRKTFETKTFGTDTFGTNSAHKVSRWGQAIARFDWL
jgi:hypothetical protein